MSKQNRSYFGYTPPASLAYLSSISYSESLHIRLDGYDTAHLNRLGNGAEYGVGRTLEQSDNGDIVGNGSIVREKASEDSSIIAHYLPLHCYPYPRHSRQFSMLMSALSASERMG
jgi:hypothetical protein